MKNSFLSFAAGVVLTVLCLGAITANAITYTAGRYQVILATTDLSLVIPGTKVDESSQNTQGIIRLHSVAVISNGKVITSAVRGYGIYGFEPPGVRAIQSSYFTSTVLAVDEFGEFIYPRVMTGADSKFAEDVMFALASYYPVSHHKLIDDVNDSIEKLSNTKKKVWLEYMKERVTPASEFSAYIAVMSAPSQRMQPLMDELRTAARELDSAIAFLGLDTLGKVSHFDLQSAELHLSNADVHLERARHLVFAAYMFLLE